MAEPDGVLRPGIVHRLDKDTSGVMVVARTPFSRTALSRQFKDRTVKKTYLAIVKGKVARDRVTIERPVGRHPIERKRMSVRSNAPRDAVSHITVLARFDPADRDDARRVVGAGETRHWPDASDSRSSRVDWPSLSWRSFVWRQSGRQWIFPSTGAACAGAFFDASAIRRVARVRRTAADGFRRISRDEVLPVGRARASPLDRAQLTLDEHPRFAKNIGHAYCCVALLLEHLHDDCVVRTSAVQGSPADVGDCRELANRVFRILLSGSRESDRLRRIHGLPAQDHPGDHNAGGLRDLRLLLPGRSAAMELPGIVRMHSRRSRLRVLGKNLGISQSRGMRPVDIVAPRG